MEEHLNRIYLLYVDDEDILLKSTKLYLEQTSDFIVDTASSGEEGLEKINSRRYDAVISDYQMPGMDGIEFLKAVRKSGNDIPFIIFTGKGREEVAMDALNAGADYYLQKGGSPKVQFSELKNFVRQAVEKNHAVKRLLEHERRMEEVINFLPDPTFAIDNDGKVIAWNHAIEEITGISSSEMLGKDNSEYSLCIYGHRRPSLIDLVLNRDLQREVSYPVTESENSGILYAEIFTTSFYGGKGAYLRLKASPLYHPDGSIAGAIESMHDISCIKEAEKELDYVKNRLELAMDASEHGFWDWNLDTDEIYFSPRYYTMLGYQPGELPMSLSTWVEMMHPIDCEEVLPKIYDHIKEARAYREDFRLRKKDGSWMWISGRSKSYEVDDDGIPHRAVGTHVDVTYRKNTEEALKILNKKLNLLSSVTRHDVINQISGLRAYQELLKCEIDEEKIRVYLKPMIKATEVIEKKIRFTSDYQDLGIHTPAWQNAESVIQSVIPHIHGVRIKLESSVSGLEIYADPMLNKVFYNLFENAFRHGGHVTEVIVSFNKTDDMMIVVVRDNGQGVAPSMKERIFMHGFGSNTGLGLFLVREILEITGISISETGTEGDGARFEIAVPKGSYRLG